MLQYIFLNGEFPSDLLYKNISKLNSYKIMGGMNLRTGYFTLTTWIYPKVLGSKNIFKLLCICISWGQAEDNGIDREFGVDRCELLHLEQKNNGALLYSTGNHVQSLRLECDGR